MIKPEMWGLNRLDSASDPDEYDWVVELPTEEDKPGPSVESAKEVHEAADAVKAASQVLYEAILVLDKKVKGLTP